jgi:hypothetical protein
MRLVDLLSDVLGDDGLSDNQLVKKDRQYWQGLQLYIVVRGEGLAALKTIMTLIDKRLVGCFCVSCVSEDDQ